MLELKLYRVKLKLSGKIGFIGKKSFDQNIFAAALDSHMQMSCQWRVCMRFPKKKG